MIGILDYGSGNLFSISNALKKIDLASEKFDFDLNKRAEELEINNFFEILNLYENKL